MTLSAAILIVAELDRARDGFPDRDHRFHIEVACYRLMMKHQLELSPEEVEEAVRLVANPPTNLTDRS